MNVSHVYSMCCWAEYHQHFITSDSLFLTQVFRRMLSIKSLSESSGLFITQKFFLVFRYLILRELLLQVQQVYSLLLFPSFRLRQLFSSSSLVFRSFQDIPSYTIYCDQFYFQHDLSIHLQSGFELDPSFCFFPSTFLYPLWASGQAISFSQVSFGSQARVYLVQVFSF